VSAWTFGTHEEVTIGGHAVAAIRLARGKGPRLSPTLLEGRPATAPNEVVLGTKTLADAHRRVGQTVAVRFGAGAAQPMRVVGRGVFPYFGQGSFTPTGLGTGAALAAPSTRGSDFVLV